MLSHLTFIIIIIYYYFYGRTITPEASVSNNNNNNNNHIEDSNRSLEGYNAPYILPEPIKDSRLPPLETSLSSSSSLNRLKKKRKKRKEINLNNSTTTELHTEQNGQQNTVQDAEPNSDNIHDSDALKQ